MIRRKLILIGNGLATGRLLDELLRRGGAEAFDIHVFGEEPHGLYNRILIGRVVDGAAPDEITLKPIAWYAANGITLHAGARIDRLDTAARVAHAADGGAHPYDIAVFATGSRAFIPPLEGLRGPDGAPRAGVLGYRTVDDGRKIRELAHAGRDAVVLGGGLLGLEAAKSLRDAGMNVVVVQRPETLMDQQVDSIGGGFLRREIERLGIGVVLGVRAAGVAGLDRVEGLILDSGRTLPADLIVLACGIRPRVEAAEASGLEVRRGIVVDDRLATAAPGVFAVGECAEHDGQVYGIVMPIWEQCVVLADLLTGSDPRARYRGSKPYTKLKVAGVDVTSMGLIRPEGEDEVVQVVEERKGIYRKLIVRDGRLVGAILVGDAEGTPNLARWLDRGDPLPPNRLDLLCSADALVVAADPEVCNCHHVTESTLEAAIRAGHRTLPQLADRTRAGTGCGTCRGALAKLILAHAPTEPAPTTA